MTWFLGKDEDYKDFAAEVFEDHLTQDIVIAIGFIAFVNFGIIYIFKKTSKKDNQSHIQMEVNEAVS
jgi:hypothetical protein